MFIISCDLAKTFDYTVICVVDRTDESPHRYHLRYLERFNGASYPAIVARLKELADNRKLFTGEKPPVMVIDSTGVGAAVDDMLREFPIPLVGIKIHGGNIMTRKGSEFHVPKRALIHTLAATFRKGLLKMSVSITAGQYIVKELQAFTRALSRRTGHDTYNGKGEHDDIILALAMAVYTGEQIQ